MISRNLTTAIALLSCAAALSCGPAPAWVDGEGLMFDPDWIPEVHIELDPADFEVLRNQTRDPMSVFCAETPPENPFTYFEGKITVDGFEVESVGIRKKCFFGSCDYYRPSFKVSFNHYVRGQRFFGMRRMTLNNCKSDPSKVRQCLGYWLFDRAGVISPRCNFAHVMVNDEDLGLYAHIESIKTELLARYFDDTGGNLYEGALSDFQPDWVGTFQKKTNEFNPDRSDLEAMVNACAAPDREFPDDLERLIDLNAFYDFWVMEVLVAHLDGYAGRNHNNYYIYSNPRTGKFHFIPWGIDAIFRDFQTPIRSVYADAIIPHRLYKRPESRDIYISRLKEKLDQVWIEEEILSEIDRMETLISPEVYTHDVENLPEKINEVRDFVRSNAAAIRAEIDPEPPIWTTELPGPPCLRVRGNLNATFSTTWGSINSPDPWGSGTGTFNAVLDDLPIPISFVSSIAGIDPNPEGQHKPLVQVLASVPHQSGELLIAAIVAINDPGKVAPGASVPLNLIENVGYIYRQDPLNPDAFEVFTLMDGSLKFEEAAMTNGAPITGSIESKIRESGW
jgi:hypothetical protein